MKASSTYKLFLIILAGLGILLWGGTGNAIFLRLAYLAIGLLAVAGLLSIFLTKGIQVRRSNRLHRASVGDIFEERFEVGINSLIGCPWMEVINESPLPGATDSKLLTNLKRKENRFFLARTLLTKRGAYLLGPTRILSGDPFGLFPIEVSIPAKETLIVYPQTYPIADFPPPPGLLPGGKTIRIKTMDVTPHAAGIREYTPGDPMKRIHWPSTARKGQFMVKEFEQDPQAEIWLFLDGQRSVHARRYDETPAKYDERMLNRKPEVKLPQDSFEYAISIAGSLAQYYLRNRKTVGLVCTSARSTILPSERGERQLGKVMETLAFLQADGSIPLPSVVSMQAKQLPLGTGVILITPSTRPELLVALEHLQRLNLRPIVILLKAATFGSEEPTDEAILSNLLSMNIPVSQVGYGDNLGNIRSPFLAGYRVYKHPSPSIYSKSPAIQ